MGLYRMFDAAVPPQSAVPGCAAVAGYIGGAATRVWTLEDWLRFSHLRQLPIWVADFSRDAAEQGREAVAEAVRLGWFPHARHRRAIVIDMETSEDSAFVTAFAEQVRLGGFVCWPYGSKSAIYADPAMDGYWVAAWDGLASLERMPHAVLHQYADDVPFGGTQVDLSVGSGEVLVRLGHGPRR